jgi:hypothetical protein
VTASSEQQPVVDVDLRIRQLELVDRILGLEAQVARLTVSDASAWQGREVARLQGELAAAYGSRTWRIGSALVKPLRGISALRSRSKR